MVGFLNGSSEQAILVVRVLELVWNDLLFASFRFRFCYDLFRGSFSSWADILASGKPESLKSRRIEDVADELWNVFT